jgi:hypothetical protein
MNDERETPELVQPDAPDPPTFDEAVRTGVQRLQDALTEFETMVERIPEAAFLEGEGRVLEATAAEVESLVEAGQIDFESAAYDSEAWYPIVEDLQRVSNKLYEAIFLMRDVERRISREQGPAEDPSSGTVL